MGGVRGGWQKIPWRIAPLPLEKGEKITPHLNPLPQGERRKIYPLQFSHLNVNLRL